MEEKCECDMRGMLSFHVLWLLSKKPMNGEEIAEEIGKRRGEKPKSGTIYPALKDMKEKSLIKSEKSGKAVMYSITPLGRKTFKIAMEYFYKAFGEIFEDYKK